MPIWPNELPIRLNERSTWNRPRNTGVWMNIGRQPRRGLKPSSFCSLRVSVASFSRSFLYRACSAFILGCISCIFREKRICLAAGQNRITRSVTTRKTTASAQTMPLDSGWSAPGSSFARKTKTVCHSQRIPEMG